MAINLFGVSGKINSGKDLTGEIIQILSCFPEMSPERVVEHFNRDLYNCPFEIKKFADKLKDMVCLLIGCTREQLEDREFKEKELGEEWRVLQWTDKLFVKESWLDFTSQPHFEGEKVEEHWEKHSYIPTPRKLLQLLGTECGRQILHPNIWVNALFADYRPKNTLSEIDNRGNLVGTSYSLFPRWVITDVRFPNEAEAIKNRGGVLIRVERPDKNGMPIKSEDHLSETALDSYKYFHETINNTGSLVDLVVRVKSIMVKYK